MKNKIAILISTWFGSGLIPPVILKGMAGTYGSLFSIPLVCLALYLNETTFSFAYLAIVLIVYLIGLWSVRIAEEALGPRTDWKGKTKTRDQNQIVIDETLGMLITCSLLRLSDPSFWWLVLIGFGFFRLFDIIKLWPTKKFDRMHTANGVMLDDVVAGFYALFFLQIISIIFF